MEDLSKYEAVVAKRWDYYAPRFRKLARGAWLSWNWAAFAGTFAWLRYRKLHAWSWIYFLVSTPSLVAAYLINEGGTDRCAQALDPGPDLLVLFAVLILLVLQWVIFPLVANRLYFDHARRVIRVAADTAGTGGYGGALILQGLLLIVVVFVAPNFSNYRHRAMVGEGITLARNAQLAVQEYLGAHQRLPESLEEAMGAVSGKYADRLDLDADGTILVLFGKNAEKLSGRTLSFVPQWQDGGIDEWDCRSDNIPDVCLPVGCVRH